MKLSLRRALAGALSAALIAGLCLTASAYTYPKDYWPLHDAWESADSAQNLDQVLTTVQQTYDLLSKDPVCQDICWNLQPKCAKASWAAEIKGDLNSAITWAERELVYAQWLHDNVGGYEDILLNTNARLEYLRAAAHPAVYALTSDATNCGGGSPTLGTWLGSDANGSESGESAVLFYISSFNDGYSVKYWLDYHANTYPKFKSALDNGDTIELAWNIKPQSTAGVERVLDPAAESYISEGLAELGKLKSTVLLRLGAEMNNWEDCNAAKFQEAFRKVANEAHKYGNIKMVFSPDNVSNRHVSFSDFYPGDQYVDWIGMSTYHTTNYNSFNGGQGTYAYDDTRYQNDAYYGFGVYDSDPLIIFAPVARFAQQHNKPMMISECGFSHRSASGGDQTVYAVDQMNKFYSYVNMIYPQIRAVFYFDVAIRDEPYAYRLDSNADLGNAYRTAIRNNGGYLHQGDTSGKNWKRLDQTQITCQAGDSLKLAAYAPFPGNNTTSVKYYVDGNLIYTATAVPYYLDLDTSNLSGGKHTVRAEASSGQFSQTSANYEITVTVPGQLFPDVDPKAWHAPYIKSAVEKKLFTGNADGTFGPDHPMTYAQFLTVLSQFSNDDTSAPAGSAWYQGYVDWAKNKNLIPAEILSSFNPDAPISRQDMAALFGAFLSAYNVGFETKNPDQPSFLDQNTIPAYAAEGVALCYKAGIMSGNADGTFAPNGTATRAQVAVTMTNMAAIMGK